MRLHRFYIGKKIGDESVFEIDSPDLSNQLRKVFRYKPGDSVILFDNTGFEYTANISDFEKDTVKFEIIEKIDKSDQINKKISLFASVVKKDTFEWIVEKATELGVTNIYPILSERSEKKNLNMDRLNKIVVEASEQSGRVILPKVSDILEFKDALYIVNENKLHAVVFHTAKDLQVFSNTDRSFDSIFIGPEGGFTEGEIKDFILNKIPVLSLGELTLRSETAAIVALAKII